jgi:hypothetical protein
MTEAINVNDEMAAMAKLHIGKRVKDDIPKASGAIGYCL